MIILAGGRGSRMGNETDIIPKPMVKIGGIPIIEHIMNSFHKRLGSCEFIIASGYRSEVIEEHFQGFPYVKVVNTGIETQTAGRLKKLNDIYNFQNPFYLCYGDGLTDFNFPELNIQSRGVVNMLVVHPIGRFGEVNFDESKRVTGFQEKPVHDRWINGGYFFVNPEIFSYIKEDSDILETDVFQSLVPAGKLYCTPYDGYWHCMDTPKDQAELNKAYENGDAPWLKSL